MFNFKLVLIKLPFYSPTTYFVQTFVMLTTYRTSLRYQFGEYLIEKIEYIYF